MTGEEFMELYRGNTELRQYIVDIVKAYTKDPGRRAHLLYTAWIAISNAKRGQNNERYYCVVYSALRKEWQKKYLEKHIKYPCLSPAVQRANYRVRQFSKKTT